MLTAGQGLQDPSVRGDLLAVLRAASTDSGAVPAAATGSAVVTEFLSQRLPADQHAVVSVPTCRIGCAVGRLSCAAHGASPDVPLLCLPSALSFATYHLLPIDPSQPADCQRVLT